MLAEHFESVLLLFRIVFFFWHGLASERCHTFDPKWSTFIKRYWSQGLHCVNCVVANRGTQQSPPVSVLLQFCFFIFHGVNVSLAATKAVGIL